MNKIERVTAALRGEPIDRVPACFFFHFPETKQAGHAMAQAHLEYYRAASPDFLKVMDDISNYSSPMGLSKYYSSPMGLSRAEDWAKLRPAPLSSQCYQDQLSGLREIVKAVGDEVLVITTIFNPFWNGNRMSDSKAAQHLKAYPEKVEEGLAAIAESLAKFVHASIEVGIDGIYFAAHGGQAEFSLTPEEFNKHIKPHDLTVLRAAKDAGASFNLLHICGERLRFEPFVDYQADAVNWAPQLGNPSLSEGRRLFKKTVMGGVNQRGPIVSGTHEEIEREVQKATNEMGTRRFILGAGCTLPSDTPIERIVWAREAVLSRRS